MFQLPVVACGAVAAYLLVRLIHGVATFRSYPEALDELKRVSLWKPGTVDTMDQRFIPGGVMASFRTIPSVVLFAPMLAIVVEG